MDRGTINLKRHFSQEIMIFIQASYKSHMGGFIGTSFPHHMATHMFIGYPFIWGKAAVKKFQIL